MFYLFLFFNNHSLYHHIVHMDVDGICSGNQAAHRDLGLVVAFVQGLRVGLAHRYPDVVVHRKPDFCFSGQFKVDVQVADHGVRQHSRFGKHFFGFRYGIAVGVGFGVEQIGLFHQLFGGIIEGGVENGGIGSLSP